MAAAGHYHAGGVEGPPTNSLELIKITSLLETKTNLTA